MVARSRAGPSLQHFIVQAEIVASYRKAVRATRTLPDEPTRRETLDFLRSDLDRLRTVSELETLKSSLQTFNRTLKQLAPSMGLAGNTAGARLVGRGGARRWDVR
ncbi:hypothetical protein Q5752_006805 [Cryptotrichosporon argae]